jgi:cation diffusion facilitator CzcD-associated flavoprotein CzcO
VFVREPSWVISKGEHDYSERERRHMSHPIIYRLERIRTFALEQWRFRGGKQMRLTDHNRHTQAVHEEYIATVFKDRPDLAAAVTPDHPYFGKRPVKATGFYETILRDDVTFIRRAVTRVTKNGVVDSAGEEHQVDAIVMATGFRPAEYLREIDVIGRDGRSIHDVWNGDPDAFLGLTVPGFPNFYMLYGPNTNMGMIVFNLETEAEYAIRDIKRMIRTGVTAIEVRRVFHRVYNTWLQKKLSKTVWVEANNYYKSPSGKLVVPFHTAMIVYWALCRVLRRASAFDRRSTWRPRPAGDAPDAREVASGPNGRRADTDRTEILNAAVRTTGAG